MNRNNIDKYRWVVLIASCLINLCIGSIYAWSVFAGPLAEKLTLLTGTELTAGSLAIVYTVANSVGPITMISGGFLNEKLGTNWVIFIGGLLFGGGMIATGLASSKAMIILTYGLGVGLGIGMVYGCTINNSVKFFPDKKGLIGGVATAVYGMSSVIIPPIANAFIETMSVTTTFILLGGIFLVVVCLASFFVMRCPDGYAPKGFEASKGEEKQVMSTKPGAKTPLEKDWKGMLKTPVFYLMIFMLTCGAFSGLMITSQTSPMAQSIVGASTAVAATVVSILALFNAGGRILAGYLSDIIGRINVLFISFVLEMAGLILIITSHDGDLVKFIIGASIMGLCFGSLMGVYPGFTADQFGTKHNSVNYGIMFIGFALAGYFGPTTVSKILASTGAYTYAFYVAFGLAIVGLVLGIIFKVSE